MGYLSRCRCPRPPSPVPRGRGSARWLLGCLLTLAAGEAWALTEVPRPLDEVLHGADAVVVGVVIDKVVEEDAVTGRPTTLVTIDASRVLSGVLTPGPVILRTPGGETPRGTLLVPGMPTYEVGEEVTVALEGAQDGSFVLRALTNGLFRARDRDDGARVAVDHAERAVVAPLCGGVPLIARVAVEGPAEAVEAVSVADDASAVAWAATDEALALAQPFDALVAELVACLAQPVGGQGVVP